MRKVLIVLIAMVFCASAVAIAEHHEKTAEGPWFDMENCDFCKNLLKNDKLLENMTWEHHKISNGVITITTVNPEFKAAYKVANDAMMAIGMDMQMGKVNPKDVKMCNHCKAYGKLMEAGVKNDFVQGKGADVTVLTSDKPEILAMINDYADRTNDETAKMEAAMADDPHKGHKH